MNILLTAIILHYSCLKPDGDWVNISKAECVKICRINPWNDRRECGKWERQ